MKFMLNLDYISVNFLGFESNKLGNFQHHISGCFSPFKHIRLGSLV